MALVIATIFLIAAIANTMASFEDIFLNKKKTELKEVLFVLGSWAAFYVSNHYVR